MLTGATELETAQGECIFEWFFCLEYVCSLAVSFPLALGHLMGGEGTAGILQPLNGAVDGKKETL